jgi:transcriptional regulator with XRE-family HTH domain
VRKSSISKHLGWGPGSRFAVALGAEVRRRRKAAGYTQRELASPLTGAYVSAIETGRCLPSVGALLLMATHLGVDPGELLSAVKQDCPDVYTPRHATGQDQAAAHRR